MASGARRFALQQLDRVAADVPDLPLAEVTAIDPTGGTDAEALVTVLYLGAELDLPHLAHYTPTVGDKVALARYGGVWTIIGRPVGFPS